ncbi:hypothetical protein PQX77_005328 [Marasmius sp. AFHP31]|nr:hypothetical protein PQX77_005328 [Marasmius sp. AFHP31]
MSQPWITCAEDSDVEEFENVANRAPRQSRQEFKVSGVITIRFLPSRRLPFTSVHQYQYRNLRTVAFDRYMVVKTNFTTFQSQISRRIPISHSTDLPSQSSPAAHSPAYRTLTLVFRSARRLDILDADGLKELQKVSQFTGHIDRLIVLWATLVGELEKTAQPRASSNDHRLQQDY